MNEHDSERLAGILERDGLVATDSVDDADVVVLNTCCIRENADNKLYGHLGHLKAVKDRRPDLQIAVGGCLAQKDRAAIQERGPLGGRRLGHPQRGPGRRPPRRGRATARTGAGDPRRARTAWRRRRAFPSALPVRRDQAWAAWVTIQIGCDNNCAFCIVPAVRGPEISRPFGQIVAEVEQLAAAGTVEVTLLGQNVNSYGRDLTTRLRSAPDWQAHARSDRAGLGRQRRGPGPGPCSPTCCGGGPRRRHPAGSLHQPPPQGSPARDHRGHGDGAGGLPAAAPSPAGGQRPDPGPHAPGLHRRRATWSGWPRPGRRSTIWP